MKNILIVDGDGLLCRAHFAVGKEIFTPKNQEVGGVDKFIRVLMRQIELWNANSLFVAFDPVQRATVRHKEYSLYKANRTERPEGLVYSKTILLPILSAMGAVCVSNEDYEADDLMAAMVEKTQGGQWHAIVSSHDKDILGLTQYEHVTVAPPFQTEVLKAQHVESKLGIRAEQVMDYLALLGDDVDNVPGVDHCGKIRAASLLKKYGTLEDVLAAAHRGDIAKKLGESLRAQGTRAIAFRNLMRLRTEAFTPHPDACIIGDPAYNLLLPLLKENNLMSLHADALASAINSGYTL